MPRKIVVPEGTKWCCYCKKPRPIEEFSPGDKRCRPCVKAYRHKKYGTKTRIIPPDGMMYCFECKTIKQRSEFHPHQQKVQNGGVYKNAACCKQCVHYVSYKKPVKPNLDGNFGLNHHSAIKELRSEISKDPIKLAYAAGLFDAEGSAIMGKSSTSGPTMYIWSNNSCLLDTAQNTIGGIVRYFEELDENGLLVNCGRLDITSLVEVNAACDAIIPYLNLKKRRCEILKEACFLSPYDRIKLRDELDVLNKKCIREFVPFFEDILMTEEKMNALSDINLSYLAGLVDGDGWIHYANREAVINVCSTKLKTITYLHGIFGGHIEEMKTPDNAATACGWHLHADEQVFQKFLRRFKNFLVLKKTHADIAAWCIGNDQEKRRKLSKRMSELTAFNRAEKRRRIEAKYTPEKIKEIEATKKPSVIKVLASSENYEEDF